MSEKIGQQGVEDMFCKECGEAVDAGSKFCSKCGASMSAESSFKQLNESKANVEETGAESQNESEFGVLDVISFLFYLIAVIDWAGMFFDYDFTGVYWSPLAFGLVGAVCQTISKKRKSNGEGGNEK